jgi:hypothetical protein
MGCSATGKKPLYLCNKLYSLSISENVLLLFDDKNRQARTETSSWAFSIILLYVVTFIDKRTGA